MVVAPSCQELASSFSVFDHLILSINEARRNARDYVTDFALKNNNADSDWHQEWVTSVSMAHLHPDYGTYVQNSSGESTIKGPSTSKTEEDPATKAYIERKMVARRSPYPSMVIEVRSMPPFVNESPQDASRKKAGEAASRPRQPDQDESVSMEDVKKLEALFGMKATFSSPEDNREHEVVETSKSGEDALWDAIGKATGIEQITFLTPVDIGQKWVAENDRLYDAGSSYFASFDTQYVDAAYEFVFATISMQRNRAKAAIATENNRTAGDISLKRDYLLMPNFLSKAATSFDKFSGQVQNIINAIPGISEVLTVSTFHPEHVDKSQRSPIPILVLEWIPQHLCE